jgi:hypothetical protein
VVDRTSARLLARQAQLVRAVHQAEIANLARAGARARLAALDLRPRDRAATRSARSAVGRALREARLRAGLPRPALDELAARRTATAAPKRRGRAGLLSLFVAALAVLALALWPFQAPETARSENVDGGGAAPGGDASAQAQVSDHSRGRTSDRFSAVAAPSPATAEPTVAASAPPSGIVATVEQSGPGGGSGGTGRVGTGTGTGSGPGSGSGTVSAPPPTPAPTAVQTVQEGPGFTRIRGRVLDSNTGLGVAGVCIVPGSLDCDVGKPRSDANGYWVIDVTNGTYWDIKFLIDGYRVSRVRVYAGGNDTNVGNVRIQRIQPVASASPPKP